MTASLRDNACVHLLKSMHALAFDLKHGPETYGAKRYLACTAFIVKIFIGLWL